MVHASGLPLSGTFHADYQKILQKAVNRYGGSFWSKYKRLTLEGYRNRNKSVQSSACQCYCRIVCTGGASAHPEWYCDVARNKLRGTCILGGSLLIAGFSGMGRADVVRLVASTHQMEVFTPAITASYAQKNFENDLKQVRIPLSTWSVV